MVNEWSVVELYGANSDGEVRRYTIADGTAVSKGTLMALSTPRTVTIAVNNPAAVYAGVTSEEKAANDGTTSIGCWTNGIFLATCSGAVTAGMGLGAGQLNQVNPLINGASGAMTLGYALSAGSASAATISTVDVRLRL